ncbi:MAG: 16S rRNA (uracil(1498)-N(3))-methyltransferase [Desulfobulbaceae bacterium]|nr:16S rRNA (uracil(1498)-N(3))-methyltransferase [Desulfobulbaceae bacterium]HIJ79951.1 16S rRNA (uracil(1498)-N(3))-methyltransferase [Deltaproteobacteria bacterium]
MTAHRFFIDPACFTGNSAILTGPEAHHLRSVLRLAPGELITLFDGSGNRFSARIDKISKKDILTTIIEKSRDQPTPVALHLGQSVLKGQKMELVAQKATELGIESIHPFLSEHGANKSQQDKKIDRWQRITMEACKQCNRAGLPRIYPVINFEELLADHPPCDLKLIFWEKESEQSLTGLFAKQQQPLTSVMIVIGPEGGFSNVEIDNARKAGFIPVSMGTRVLRAETAAITATAILQFILGNLSPGGR